MLFPSWLHALKTTSRRKAARSFHQRTATGRRPPRRPSLEALEDRTLLSAYLVTTTADSGPGSLRDAINQINADTSHTLYTSPTNPNIDEIDFDITAASDAAGGGSGYNATTGVATIAPRTVLPPITTSVWINGFSQPGSTSNTHLMTDPDPTDNAVQLITLDGSQAGTSADGLVLAGGNSTVSGLVIQHFAQSGIHLETTGSDVIDGNRTANNGGNFPYPNDNNATQVVYPGILVDNVPNNTIGGTAAAARNQCGDILCIAIVGTGATGNVVEGNYLGTDGNHYLTSTAGGVAIMDASNNTIGGITSAARNDIAVGQSGGGVVTNWISSPGPAGVIFETQPGVDDAENNVVEGNYIGLNAAGTAVVTSPASSAGVDFEGDAGHNIIGGLTAGARNVISGWQMDVFGNDGSLLSNDGNLLEGNYIGTNAAGTAAAAVAWQGNGVWAQGGGIIVGGTANGAGNVISGITGNAGLGPAAIYDNDCTVQGNLIGTDFTGTKPIPNSVGVLARSGDVTIGGTQPGAGNIIAYSQLDGIDVNEGTGVRIEGNSIYGNGQLGIVLGGGGRIAGVNTNADNNQANHQGPNNLMNFPVLTSVQTSAGGTTINGTLDTGTANGVTFLPNATITLDFYANSPTAVDPSGYGQGQTWLGSMTVTTDANGNASFTSPSFNTALPAGDFVTATATDASGDTSEFSADIPVGPTSGGPYAIVAGGSATFYAAAGPGTSPTGYFWLVNGQGYGSVSNSTGYNPTLTWAQLQGLGITGPGTYNVQAEWVNNSNGTTLLPMTTLTVQAAPVTATIATSLPADDSGNSTTTAGTPIALSSSVTDPNTGNVPSYSWAIVEHPEPSPLGTTLVHTTQYATRDLGESSGGSAVFAGANSSLALGAADGLGWVPDQSDSSPYLTLGFDTPMYADGVAISENAGAYYAGDYNGFVTRVDLLDTNDQYHTVWSGTDPTHSISESAFTLGSGPGATPFNDVSWSTSPYLVEGVRIYTTNYSPPFSSGIVANVARIDAVQLSGSYDPTANGSVPLSGSYDPAVNRGRSDQYATSVLTAASSPSYGGINHEGQYGTADVVGAPDALGGNVGGDNGDNPVAWSPATENSANGAPATLAVGFDIPVYADGVTIRETEGNGFVTAVDVLDPNGSWEPVWSGTDPTLPGAPTDFRVNWVQTSFLVSAVRIHLSTSHILNTYDGIDSVQLHGWFTPATPIASGTGSSLTFTPSATDTNATYFATLTATDSLGNVAMAQTTIDVAPSVSPTAHITNPTYSSGTVGLTLTATDPTPGDKAASFTIDWGDGSAVQTLPATNGSATPSHAYATAGTYKLIVTATDTAGMASSIATAIVEVTDSTNAYAVLLGGGVSAGQVSIGTVNLASAVATPPAIYIPTDLVFVVGQNASDTYTLNFGPTLTTPIAIAAAGGSLTANGADGDNYFDKVLGQNGTPNQLSWAPIYGAATPVETVTFTGTSTTILVGGSGSNYFIDPGSATTIDGGPAANTFVITATSGSGVVIHGGPSTNNYVIDLGSLAGPVTILNSNPGAADSLTIIGAPGNNTIAVADNQVTAGTQTLTFSQPLTNLTINGGSGNNQLTVSSLTAPVSSITLVGGAGTNSYTVNAGTVSIVAGTADNILTVSGGKLASITAPAGVTSPIVFADNYTVLDNAVLSVAAGSGVLANDLATVAGGLTAVLDQGPAHGTLAFNADGSFTYTPAANYVGTDTFTYQAKGGNGALSAVATVTVQVTYHFSGFLPPLNQNLAFGIGRTVPIKFQLTDYAGHAISSLSAVTAFQVIYPDGSSHAIAGLASDGKQYHANWQTKGLAAGSYTISLTLLDGTTHTVTLQLTANGSGANAQAADGSDVSEGSLGGQLLGGDLEVYVDNSNGELTSDELARIQDAITAVDAVTEPYGVTVEETTDPTQAEVTLDMAATSPVGGYAHGILGCFDPTAGQITLIQGWNWYAGSDPTQIDSSQYDFQTTVTHELGHALGLGESSTSTSAMYGTLAPGTVIRTLSTADLNVPYDEDGADPQRAAVPAADRTTGASGVAPSPDRAVVSSSSPGREAPPPEESPGTLLGGTSANGALLPGEASEPGSSPLAQLAAPQEARGAVLSNPSGPVSVLRSENASLESGSTAPALPGDGPAEEPLAGPLLVSSPSGSVRAFRATVTVPAAQVQRMAPSWRQACDACFLKADRLPGPRAEGRPLSVAPPEVGDSAAALAALALFLAGSGKPSARSAAEREEDARRHAPLGVP